MLWSMHQKLTFTLFITTKKPAFIWAHKCLEYLQHHIQCVSSSRHCMHNQEKSNEKKKTLCLCLIQKWCRCKCYSVGRCESNSSQFRCCRPFSVMKIGFLVNMILLATKSCDRVTVMQMEMVKKMCPGLKKMRVYPHDNWQIQNGVHSPLCFQCFALSPCNECDTLLC